MTLRLVKNEQPQAERDATAALLNYGQKLKDFEACRAELDRVRAQGLSVWDHIDHRYWDYLTAVLKAQRDLVHLARELVGLPHNDTADVVVLHNDIDVSK